MSLGRAAIEQMKLSQGVVEVSQGVIDAVADPVRSRLFAIAAAGKAKWIVAGIWLVAFLGSFALDLPGKFADAEQNENVDYLPASAESTKALGVAERLNDGDVAPAIVVYRRDGGLTAGVISPSARSRSSTLASRTRSERRSSSPTLSNAHTAISSPAPASASRFRLNSNAPVTGSPADRRTAASRRAGPRRPARPVSCPTRRGRPRRARAGARRPAGPSGRCARARVALRGSSRRANEAATRPTTRSSAPVARCGKHPRPRR